MLEEIDHNNVTPQDETPEVVVEYSNLKSYRVSLDQFIREVDNKREKDGFREEFKVLNADQSFLFYTYNEYLYFRKLLTLNFYIFKIMMLVFAFNC